MSHDEYYFLLLQLKAVFLKLVYFHLDEHFQVNRLLIKYCYVPLYYDYVSTRQDSLTAHNSYRAKHGVAALKISAELNALAQVYL